MTTSLELQACFSLSEDFLAVLKDRGVNENNISLAIGLFCSKRISLNRAASLVGISLKEFQNTLKSLGLLSMGYMGDEFKELKGISGTGTILVIVRQSGYIFPFSILTRSHSFMNKPVDARNAFTTPPIYVSRGYFQFHKI